MANGVDANGSGWWGSIAKFGFPIALSSAVLWFFAYYVYIPTRDDQRELQRSVSKTNEGNAETLKTNSETLRAQTRLLESLSRGQEENNRLQKELLDATRKGAWRASP